MITGTFLFALILAIGIVWAVFSLLKGLGDVWRQLKPGKGKVLPHPIKAGRELKRNPFLKDFLGSVLLMAIGSFILIGVMGMAVGLIASVIFSIIIWMRRLFRRSS